MTRPTRLPWYTYAIAVAVAIMAYGVYHHYYTPPLPEWAWQAARHAAMLPVRRVLEAGRDPVPLVWLAAWEHSGDERWRERIIK